MFNAFLKHTLCCRSRLYAFNRFNQRCTVLRRLTTEGAPEEEIIETKDLKINEFISFSPPKPLEEIATYKNSDKVTAEKSDFLDTIGPPLPAAFNLAAFVNRSETLVKLVQLGVDLSLIEKVPEKAKYVVTLDFEKDIKSHIQFLHDHGVESECLGRFITKNPFIFKEKLENLQIRINYLESKRFSKDNIARIITKNPFILSTETKQLDSRLGFLQKQFSLTGDEVRHVFTRCPKLVSYEFKKFLEKIFIMKEVFGFTEEERKKILLMKPKIWMLGPRVLKERFDIVHNIMGISHERILEFPGVFLKRSFLLKQRHQYLVHLGRAQYDPKEPNFVSLYVIATTTDYAFCKKCAKTSLDQFNEFLKTL